MSIRRRTAELLEAHRPGDPAGRLVDVFLMVLILANVAALILETVEPLQASHRSFFRQFEIFSVAVFTVEYLARLWSCVEKPLGDPKLPRQRRIRWMASPLGIIDLLAILPFYLFLLIPGSAESLLMLRLFRAMRLLRIFKLTRYSPALNIIVAVVRKEAPVLLVAASVLSLMLLISSWGIYLLEREQQPEYFGSIPQAMWWAIITLTTVGYGDVVPITIGGKVFAGLVGLVGIAMLALPAAILASGFSRELHGRSDSYQRAVERALSDGRLSQSDSEALEALREDLGISTDEALQTLIEVRRTQTREATCPSCGFSATGDNEGIKQTHPDEGY